MLQLDWNIAFKTENKEHRLAFMAECEVISSVDHLADTATIVLPEAIVNQTLNFEEKVKRGSEVVIKLGYNNNLEEEFTGFVQDIIVNNSNIKILCEDALFLFRIGIPDTELKKTNVQKIAQYVIDKINPEYKVNCTYNINYEKFTIHQLTGYDVLKKLQEDTSANVFFDTKNKTLHIHEAYVHQEDKVYYSMQKNIESSSLEYKDKLEDKNKYDYKVEVTVECTDINGEVKKVTAGVTGGNSIVKRVPPMDEESMKTIAESELSKATAARYEGSFDAWLIPFVKPGYVARIKDEDYPDKTAFYYVKTVTTSLSSSGGKRTINLGVKVSE